MDTISTVRPRCEKTVTSSPAPILFAHPGYPGAYGHVFLRLEPSDVHGDVTGVDSNVALDACRIIANNQPGFLSTSKKKQDKIHCTSESPKLLDRAVYWYFLDNVSIPEKYPLVPAFREWRFPHGEVPQHWNIFDSQSTTGRPAGSTMSDRVKERDGQACVISSHTVILENAHLVPKSEAAWFGEQDMRRYISYNDLEPSEDNIRNGITLNAELHRALIEAYYVICPKAGRPAVHFFKLGNELQVEYHAREIYLAPHMRKEFLYARFAYNIFLCLSSFRPLANVSIVKWDGTVAPYGEWKATYHAKADWKATSDVALSQEISSHESGDDGNAAGEEFSRLQDEWFRDHPQIRQVSSPSGMKLDDGGETEEDVMD